MLSNLSELATPLPGNVRNQLMIGESCVAVFHLSSCQWIHNNCNLHHLSLPQKLGEKVMWGWATRGEVITKHKHYTCINIKEKKDDSRMCVIKNNGLKKKWFFIYVTYFIWSLSGMQQIKLRRNTDCPQTMLQSETLLLEINQCVRLRLIDFICLNLRLIKKKQSEAQTLFSDQPVK